MINLYKEYKHWQEKGPVWLIGDLHSDDEDCLRINPSWPSPEEVIKKINSKVAKNDTLIILGDVGNKEWIKKLKGYKVLVLGNHDKGESNYKRVIKEYSINSSLLPVFETIKDANKWAKENIKDFDHWVNPPLKENQLSLEHFAEPVVYTDNRLFDEVKDLVFISPKILLSHEPVDLPFGLNIHGHVHNGQKEVVKENSAQVNVCSDVIDWTPIRLDKIVESYPVKTIHRITIDKAIEQQKD